VGCTWARTNRPSSPVPSCLSTVAAPLSDTRLSCQVVRVGANLAQKRRAGVRLPFFFVNAGTFYLNFVTHSGRSPPGTL